MEIVIIDKSFEEFCAEELWRKVEKNQRMFLFEKQNKKVSLCANENDPGMRGKLMLLGRGAVGNGKKG